MLSLGQPPKKFTVPPRRTMFTAHCQVSRLAHRFDGDIHAAAAGQIANGLHGVGLVVAHHQFVGAQGCGAVQLRLRGGRPRSRGSRKLGQLHEHQPDRAQADDRDGVARARPVSSKPRTTQASGSTSAAS